VPAWCDRGDGGFEGGRVLDPGLGGLLQVGGCGGVPPLKRGGTLKQTQKTNKKAQKQTRQLPRARRVMRQTIKRLEHPQDERDRGEKRKERKAERGMRKAEEGRRLTKVEQRRGPTRKKTLR